MTLHPLISELSALGGIPNYAEETEGVFNEVHRIVFALKPGELGREDVLELAELLPGSCGEDFYGLTFCFLDLICQAMKPDWMPEVLALLRRAGSEWEGEIQGCLARR